MKNMESRITALIRTHPGREALTKHAVESAKECNVIIHHGEKTVGFEYNGYCNILKAQVVDNFFFFLDSDDFIIPGAIKKILPRLKEDKANIVQMLRQGSAVPRTGVLKQGRIGMPCLILHAKYKDLADIPETETGDFEWIKKVTELIPWQIIKIPLVNAGRRGRGL